MRSQIAIALLEDAWRQVVDNKVFRLLLLLILVPVGATFVLGFRESGIEVLFGWERLEYRDFLRILNRSAGSDAEARILAIQAFQSLIVSYFGGVLGLFFCIGATAFFVPRMMEKGAADTLFAKPVSRHVLLLSRYAAGLLFVGCLAILLVSGMFLGFWLVSGYRDPGFLWGALTLVYLYAMLYAFTVAVATLTRSSSAAILLSLMLFVFSGCVHQGWMLKELAADQSRAGTENAEEGRSATDEPAGLLGALVRALDVAHYVLPKTSEADILTDKLKRDFERRGYAYSDPEGTLWIARAPPGFESSPLVQREGVQSLAAWSSAERDTEQAGRALLGRRSRLGDTGRRPTTSRLAALLAHELEARAAEVRKVETSELRVAGRAAMLVSWVEERDGTMLQRERILLSVGDWVYELDVELAGSWEPERVASWRSDFLSSWSLDDLSALTPAEWQRRRYSWSAPLRFNLFFSVGSSLGFALAMLALAWLKLRRIDF